MKIPETVPLNKEGQCRDGSSNKAGYAGGEEKKWIKESDVDQRGGV